MNEVKESDWKLLRQLVPTALDRLSRRILDRIGQTSGQKSKTFHERFLEAYLVMENGNDEMGAAFNDLKRSNALMRLAIMKAQGLVTEDELSRFSEETRRQVAVIEVAMTSDIGFSQRGKWGNK